MYEMEVLRSLLNRYSKIMRSTGTLALLASVVLFATIARAHHTCGYKPPPSSPPCDHLSTARGIQSAISSGAQIFTYGEPCFCKESIPYSIQVPKVVEHHHRVEKLGTFGYAVDIPQQPGRCLQFPVKIQTPIIERSHQDTLRGKSYGFTVQHQEYRSNPRHLNLDFAVQTPVKVQKPSCQPCMSISIQHQAEHISPRFSPLPISVQTPLENEIRQTRLTPLSATVDRVLVPACEINGCPDCNNIIPRKHSHPLPPPYSPC